MKLRHGVEHTRFTRARPSRLPWRRRWHRLELGGAASTFGARAGLAITNVHGDARHVYVIVRVLDDHRLIIRDPYPWWVDRLLYG